MAKHRALPSSIDPMLARTGDPFDSDRHLFEVKWDGTRALAFVDRNGYRLMDRRRRDISDRYPEFAFLGTLEEGTVLDGEIVVLRDGKPDFELLLSRAQTRDRLKRRTLAVTCPASYVVFDQLYARYLPLLEEPLTSRRANLERLVGRAAEPRLVYSDGVLEAGRSYFDDACRRGLEGVIAKRLDSPYLPGERSEAWLKIKRKQTLVCVIIGFVPSGDGDFKSLILAAEEEGRLVVVGRVGTGFSDDLRAELNERLGSMLRSTPLVRCSIRGKWVEPGLYCKVTYLERTRTGQLRAPVFRELIVE